MTSKLNINWLNKCRCGNRMHTVETVRGSHVRLFEDDAVKCNSCGREGVIQTCDGIATVLWETDAERAEGEAITKLTREENVQAVFDLKAGYTLGLADVEILKRVASMALAAMDSEQVAFTSLRALETKNQIVAFTDDMSALDYGVANGWKDIVELYLHAQPAPVVPEIDRKAIADKVYGKCSRIPGATFYNAAEFAIDEMEACRAAMLQAGISAVIPDGYVMVPKEPTQAMCAAFNDSDYGRKSLRERYVAMLAAAPQEEKP